MTVYLDFEGVSISFDKCREGLSYRREDSSGTKEKTILADRGKLMLSPVEPFHTPVALSNHLLIELEHPVMLKPRSNHSLLVTFPWNWQQHFPVANPKEMMCSIYLP